MIYMYIYTYIYAGFTMGLGNDMGLHKRHGETVGLEGLGHDGVGWSQEGC